MCASPSGPPKAGEMDLEETEELEQRAKWKRIKDQFDTPFGEWQNETRCVRNVRVAKFCPLPSRPPTRTELPCRTNAMAACGLPL